MHTTTHHAHAIANPSKVLVPRPTSSMITSERDVARRRMCAVSTISTIKVERSLARSSEAPTCSPGQHNA